ncbi:hypothetical protein COOONC_09236, partial [Cooperia oncophora]
LLCLYFLIFRFDNGYELILSTAELTLYYVSRSTLSSLLSYSVLNYPFAVLVKMMVSNIMVINDLTASRIDGARCSAKVLDGMCSKMASSSMSNASSPLETMATSEDSGDSSPVTPQSKCSPHPCATLFGQFYAADDFDVLEMLGEGFFSKVSKVSF